MIISASRRTDIPAFYSNWLLQRLRDRYCVVQNPFNPRQVTRLSLCPAEVEALAFWTRDARPLLPHLPELDERGYRYFFHYTLTGYPRVFEPHTPAMSEAVETMRRLADMIGSARVIWRYDPLLFSSLTPPAYHLEQFARLADALHGAVHRVVSSLLANYRGVGARLARLAAQGITLHDLPPESAEFAEFMRGLSACAHAHGLEIVSCATPLDLRPFGIAAGKCLDADYLRRVFGISVAPEKDRHQRPACGCVASKDIGMYGSCLHGCVYCYATRSAEQAVNNHARHRVDCPSLLPEKFSG